MGYISILKTDCTHIDELEFIKWLDSKDQKWWNETHGLCKTGEYVDQDDESTVRSLISQKIKEFNETQIINSEADIGCLLALCNMIEEYLTEKCNAKQETFQEIYNETHLLVVRK